MTKSTITREQLEEWVAQLDEDGGCDATDRQLEALIRQSLAEMDGEPVAEVVSIYGDPEAFGEREIRPLVGIQQMPYGTKLYRHAQPAPVVPEEMTIRDACKFVQDMRLFDDVSVIVMRTWNACRAAMLQTKSLTSINPAPDLVSLQKKAESIIGNYPGFPDGLEHCPCCGKKLRRACSVEGCGGKHVAHGLCQKHYDMKRWEDPEQVERFREAGRRYRGKKKSTVATPQEPQP
ncbi:hypothetical protein AAHW59_09710 [Klebsiella pneumoniae]